MLFQKYVNNKIVFGVDINGETITSDDTLKQLNNVFFGVPENAPNTQIRRLGVELYQPGSTPELSS